MAVKFVTGLYVDRKADAPEFVVARLGVKVEDFANFIRQNKNEKGYVNIDILRSRDGESLYAALNTYSSSAPEKFSDGVREDFKKIQYPKDEIDANNIPF